MKKSVAFMLLFIFALVGAGCAQKSASEQLQDDMNKATKDMKKDLNGLSK